MAGILVIGIAGGSGSGKTTLTKRIAEQLGSDVTVLTHDSYYRAHHEMTYEERTQLNYDHPDSYETSLLAEHLAALRRGEPIECPVYDFSIYDRTDETVTIHPSRVIIVEGILIFCDEELRDLMDIKIFVDCDASVRILRRAQRDMEERGRSIESVINQYLATVKPMHDAFVEPSKRYANLIIPTDGDAEPDVAVGVIVSRVRKHLEDSLESSS